MPCGKESRREGGREGGNAMWRRERRREGGREGGRAATYLDDFEVIGAAVTDRIHRLPEIV